VSTAAIGPRIRVEVVVDSVQGAVAAAAAGAHRLELCCALGEGGLTPSVGLVQAVKAVVSLPVVAMLRPRGGDFLFDDSEFDVLLRDVAALRTAGADELITGMLTADGDFDRARMAAIVQAAAPLPVACHRAFDCARAPTAALEQLTELGVARVLTSGQRRTALAGAPTIATLVALAGSRITVLAGGGVRAANVRALVAQTGVREVHLSATAWSGSPMRHRNPEVEIGSAAPPGEHSLRRTDPAEIGAVLAALATPAD
jgi:copper homeostasis protein